MTHLSRLPLAVAVACAFAAGTTLSSIPAGAQELRVGMQTEPGTLDPQFNLLGSNTSALRNIYDTLIARDQNLQLVPSLALSWRPLNDTTWEFKLRPNVRFHDGSAFTAEDVKFTFARIPNVPGNPNSYAVYAAGITEVVVVDPLTVHFRTNGPTPLLPTNVSNLFIISAAKGVRQAAEFTSGAAAVGTGPYRLNTWRPGQPFVLDRNDSFWGDRPHWQRAIFRPITNDASRVSALLAGDVDFINGVPLQDIARLARDARFKVFAGQSAYVYMLYPDLDRDNTPGLAGADGRPLQASPFRDARVREAISLAINRPGIVERVMEGYATIANQAVPQGFFGHSDGVPPARFDVERARVLLREAGHPNGFQTTLHCPNDRFVNDSKICEAITQQLARVGIRVNLVAMPRTTFFPMRARREFGFHAAGWGSLTGESSYFLGAQIHSPNRALGLGAINTNGAGSPAIDAVIQQARRTLDDTQRGALLRQAMEMTMKDNLVIPVLTFQAIWAGRGDRVAFTTRADEETLAAEVKPAR
ncbi:MAG: ABC transporter substrate-binding protein [Alphaproteobacteria bacterium]|nr:ABC transporter substrate-binding protein [Alphaproteobacteria bacterium]